MKVNKKNCLGYLFIVLVIIFTGVYFAINLEKKRYKEKMVLNHGSYFLAVVKEKIVLPSIADDKVKYSIINDSSLFTTYVESSFLKQINVYDTILIKGIISDTLKYTLVLDNKMDLIPCLKEIHMPQEGWKSIPLNKCP